MPRRWPSGRRESELARSRYLFHPRCADALAYDVVQDRLRRFPRGTLHALDAQQDILKFGGGVADSGSAARAGSLISRASCNDHLLVVQGIL